MANILLEKKISNERKQELGVDSWAIWECGVEEFPWTYADKEIGYIIEGEVTVTPDGGEPVLIEAGDLVTFPKGMSCRWNITKALRKHYCFV